MTMLNVHRMSTRLRPADQEAVKAIVEAGKARGRTITPSDAIRGALKVAAGDAARAAQAAPTTTAGRPAGNGVDDTKCYRMLQEGPVVS